MFAACAAPPKKEVAAIAAAARVDLNMFTPTFIKGSWLRMSFDTHTVYQKTVKINDRILVNA
jgi:hypothetical protein